MVIVDTNIIIDHLRQTKKSSLLQKIKKTETPIAVSIISIQELFTGQSTRKKTNTAILLSLINALQILPYNYQTAKLAGQINRALSSPIEFADAAIAATAISYKIPLLTLNQKHFQKIPRLKLFILAQTPH